MRRELTAVFLACALVPGAGTASDLDAAMSGGDLILDARLRYEHVRQDDVSRDANALTLRLRGGYETGQYKGFSALIEGDLTRDLGLGGFNSLVNGKTAFPVVPDPGSERLNRLHISYTPDKDTRLTVGRQRIKLGDDRFVGNVGFRQNEQTYDAARIALPLGDDLTLDYAYVWQVNRILGSDSPTGTVDADSHFLNVGWTTPLGTLTGYGYLLDFAGGSLPSSQTYGLRLEGAAKLAADLEILYAGEVAHQRDHASPGVDYSLDYVRLEAGARRDRLSLKAVYEVLGGDGVRGFATPLATLHKFNGLTDVFLTTPAAGLRDLALSGEYSLGDMGALGPVKVQAAFHDFDADKSAASLGQEVNVGLTARPHDRVTLSLQYAEYWSTGGPGDRRKLWLALSAAY